VLRGEPNYLIISYHSQQTKKLYHSGTLCLAKMMQWLAIKHPNQPINDAVSKYTVKGKNPSKHKWVWGIEKSNHGCRKPTGAFKLIWNLT